MFGQQNNSNAEILQRFERDEKLMWPETPKENSKERRIYDNYLCELVNNPTFISASRQVEEKIAGAKRRHTNKEKITNFLLRVILIALLAGAGVEGYKTTQNYDNLTKKSIYASSGFHACLLVVLMFAVMSMLMITDTCDKDEKYGKNPEVFYNRLIVRYFDILKQMYPEMSEKYLQICNQPDMEMARAIYSLMIVNMKEADVKKLNEIALSVDCYVNKDNIENMRDIENKICQATQIIEKTLAVHPELQNIIKDSYMAKVPTTFFVVNAKNWGRLR